MASSTRIVPDADCRSSSAARCHRSAVPGEEKNDEAFSKLLAGLGDIFVNDAFSAAHRAHSSTEGMAHFLPAYAGRAMEAELKALQVALETPKRPVIAIAGGAKVSTKLDLLGNLLARVDALAIGGGMANTFLFAAGVAVGRSLCERDLAGIARRIPADAAQAGKRIILPLDAVVAPALDRGGEARVVAIDAATADAMILDVGPRTVAAIGAALAASRTLVWNGPLGAFEHEKRKALRWSTRC